MIVTIDNYRGAVNSDTSSGNGFSLKVDGSKFTVDKAGLLKLELQALNTALKRTPLAQHSQLLFDGIAKATSFRTYVDRSEEVYFMVKHLPWPGDIPDVFMKAYRQVLSSRAVTNEYISKQIPIHHVPTTIAARFSPTFSDILPLLPGLDAVCGTSLHALFHDAEQKTRQFNFLKLPTELRLQIYEHLIPHLPYIPIHARNFPRADGTPPERLELLRVSKSIHDEVTKHCFGQTTLLFQACRKAQPQYPSTQTCFNMSTAHDYAERIISMSPKAKEQITQVEIQILPTREARASFASVTEAHLEKIWMALPNLSHVLFSYPKPDPETCTQLEELMGDLYEDGVTYYRNQSITLEWLRSQLGMYAGEHAFAFDLTYFRDSVQSVEEMRRVVRCEPLMRDVIEGIGCLLLEQSAMATREDWRRWSEIEDVVTAAVEQHD